MKNKFIEEIKEDGIHYCTVVRPSLSKEGLNFITADEQSIQVGIWNYTKEKKLEPHYHNDFERKANITSETVFVSKGRILVKVYKKDKELVLEEILNEGEMIIQFYGIHEYEILNDAIVIETKNGPYFGPDKDRTRVDIG
tara:strand:+ start:609 stop:1028 length:420 start_codon:yes stop_codon:yes gene_type:complete